MTEDKKVIEPEVVEEKPELPMKPPRDEKGRFVKGFSGNPKGRPYQAKNVADYIRVKTKDFKWWVNELLALYNDPQTKTKDKLRILEVLGDRGLGKPIQEQVTHNQSIVIGVPEDLKIEDLN